MLKFWPEFPYVFKDFHASIPAFEQTPEQAERMLKRAIAKKHRRMLRNLKNQAKGGFNVADRAKSEVQDCSVDRSTVDGN